MLNSAKAALAQNAIRRPGGEQGVGVQKPSDVGGHLPVIREVITPISSGYSPRLPIYNGHLAAS